MGVGGTAAVDGTTDIVAGGVSCGGGASVDEIGMPAAAAELDCPASGTGGLATGALFPDVDVTAPPENDGAKSPPDETFGLGGPNVGVAEGEP